MGIPFGHSDIVVTCGLEGPLAPTITIGRCEREGYAVCVRWTGERGHEDRRFAALDLDEAQEIADALLEVFAQGATLE